MAYNTTILGTTGLAGYWRLGESSGTTAADESVEALDLTYAGSPTLGSTSLISDTGNTAVTFDGVDDVASADVTTWTHIYSSDASVEFLVKPSSVPTSGVLSPVFTVSLNAGSSDPSRFEVGYYSDGTDLYAYILASMFFSPDEYQYGVYGSTALSTTSANHIVAVVDDAVTGQYILYVNGVAETLTDLPGTFGNLSYSWGSLALELLSIGGTINDTPNYTDAVIDEVSAYSVALDSTTVANHYTEATSGGGVPDINATIPLQSFTITDYALSSEIPGGDLISNLPLSSLTFTPLNITTNVSGVDTDSSIPLYSFSFAPYALSSNDAILVNESLSLRLDYLQESVLLIAEHINTADSIGFSQIIQLLESLMIYDTPSYSQELYNTIIEQSTLSDSAKLIFSQVASESFTISGTFDQKLGPIITLYEQISANDSAITVGEFTISVVSALVLSGRLGDLGSILITEGLTVNSSVVSAFLYVESIVEEYIVSELASTGQIVLFAVEEDLSVSSLSDLSGSSYFNSIAENISFYLARDNDFVYEAFAFNTENYALSRYDNFNFKNSCKFNEDHLFSNETGVYRLAGSYDFPSVPITSVIKTVSMDFGTSNKKQLPKLYIGVTNSSKLILKVSVDGATSVYYQLNLETDHLDTQMFDIGKGLIGRYFQFELSTKDNSELGIDELEFFPVMFGRKVR